jgi:hypothetical protein
VNHRRSCSQGSTLIELAILLAILTPLLVGTFSLASALSARLDLIEASRLITRRSFYVRTDTIDLCEDLKGSATESLSAAGVSTERVAINVSRVGEPSLSTPFVPIQIDFAISDPASFQLFPSTFSAFVWASSTAAADLGPCFTVVTTDMSRGYRESLSEVVTS